MRVFTFLCVASMTTMLGAAVLSGTACGGGSTTGNDGGGGTKGSGGTKGTSGTGGTKGSGGTTGSGTGGSMGTGSGGSMGTGSGGSMGSGGTAGSGDGGMGFETSTCTGIDCCPDTPCSSTQSCCAQVQIDAGMRGISCQPTCTPADTLGCTLPGDCTGSTSICCATAVFNGTGTVSAMCLMDGIQSLSTVCAAPSACKSDLKLSCTATDTARLCNSSADCTESGYTKCCGLALGSKTYAVCVPPLLPSVDPSLKCN